MQTPSQLHNDAFRFIPLKGKRPIERDWTRGHNYSWQEIEQKAGNYGVVCGHGNLIVVDFDHEGVQNAAVPLLPVTFSVKTAGKGLLHLYFITDTPETLRIDNMNGERVIDVQGPGTQVVGPGSENAHVHRNYTVHTDAPIAFIPITELKRIISPHGVVKTHEKKMRHDDEMPLEFLRDPNVVVIKEKLTISDYLKSVGIPEAAPGTNCRCPMHESKGGVCLSISPDDKLWNCFHHNSGGDIFSLYEEHHGCKFIKALNDLSVRAGVNRTTFGEADFDEPFDLAINIHRLTPFFFNDAGMFWRWDGDQYKWVTEDETGILVMVGSLTGMNNALAKSTNKNKLLEAMRALGRLRTPNDPPQYFVQFRNVVLDVSTGNTMSVTPDYFFTNPIPHSLGVSTSTPHIDALFAQWCGPHNVPLLKQVIAFCISPDYFIHRIVALLGGGSNGKSKFQELVRRVLGQDNVVTSDLNTLVTQRFATWPLYRKLACNIGEIDSSSLEQTNLLKSLSGEDDIAFERKFSADIIMAKNTAKMLLAANELPLTDDPTDGFFRRWLIIDFPHQFTGDKDPLINIPEIEYENLCLECSHLLKDLLVTRKFFGETDIEAQRASFLEHSNPVIGFMRECCVTGTDRFCPAYDVRRVFNEYLIARRKRTPKWTRFCKMLSDEGVQTPILLREGLRTNWCIGLDLLPKYKSIVHPVTDDVPDFGGV